MAAQAIAAAKARKAVQQKELQAIREEDNRAWQLERELAKLEATLPGGMRRHEEDAMRATKIAAEADELAREAEELRKHQAAAAKVITDADEKERMAILANEAAQESRAADLLVRISAQIRRQQAEKYARRPQTAPQFFFSGMPGEPATRAELRGRPHVSATRRCAARSPRRIAATASPRAAAATATAAQSSTAPSSIAVTGAAPSLEEAASLPPTSLPAPPSLAAAAAVDVTPPPTPPPAPKHAPSPPRRNRPTSPVLLPLTPLLAPRKPYSPALSVPSPDSPDRIRGEVMVREVVVRGMGGLTERPDPWIHERREPTPAAAPRRPSASPSRSPRSGTASPRSSRHAPPTTPYSAAAAASQAAAPGDRLATRPPSSFGSRPSSSGLRRDEAEARARRALGATLGAGGALGAALQAVEVREISPVEEQAVGIRVERARLRVQAENCRAAVQDFGREAEVVRAQRAFEEERCGPLPDPWIHNPDPKPAPSTQPSPSRSPPCPEPSPPRPHLFHPRPHFFRPHHPPAPPPPPTTHLPPQPSQVRGRPTVAARGCERGGAADGAAGGVAGGGGAAAA